MNYVDKGNQYLMLNFTPMA